VAGKNPNLAVSHQPGGDNQGNIQNNRADSQNPKGQIFTAIKKPL
jgi:hypothetical protein